MLELAYCLYDEPKQLLVHTSTVHISTLCLLIILFLNHFKLCRVCCALSSPFLHHSTNIQNLWFELARLMCRPGRIRVRDADDTCVYLHVQMETAKKAYHMACKEEKLAATREANGKTEASVTPDQQKKLHEKVDKCKQDVQKVMDIKPTTRLFSLRQISK